MASPPPPTGSSPALPAGPDRPARLPEEAVVERAMIEMAGAAGPGGSVAPTEVAQAVFPVPDWQRALPVVRRVALRLAREGRILILRKGKPVAPEDLRGVFRLAAPRDE